MIDKLSNVVAFSPKVNGAPVDGCSVEGCDRTFSAKGKCKLHYMREWKRKRYNQTPRSLWSTQIGAKSAHYRVHRLWGRAAQYPCIECGVPAHEWAYDGTDPTDIYGSRPDNGKTIWTVFSRFPEFYMPMCRSCHRLRDRGEVTRLLHEYRLQIYGLRQLRVVESA